MREETPTKITIEVEPQELKALLRLLEDHIRWGWVELMGEFEVEASGRVSPYLERLYARLRRLPSS